MAGNRFSMESGKVATGTAAKTVAQVAAASDHGISIERIDVSFDGTSSTDAPILVEVVRQTTAGTMTSRDMEQLEKDNEATLQVTGQINATAEPTEDAVLFSRLVHPQGGFSWVFPFGQRLLLSGASGNARLGVRVTSGININCVANITGEE